MVNLCFNGLEVLIQFSKRENMNFKLQWGMLLLLLSHFSPTLCDPIDGSPPGFPTPGILQVRTLEWIAISFSNA